MTAWVLTDFFDHDHHRLEVARQEYALAKEHFREVCLHRIAGNADHDQRFRDAAERREVARERWLKLL